MTSEDIADNVELPEDSNEEENVEQENYIRSLVAELTKMKKGDGKSD